MARQVHRAFLCCVGFIAEKHCVCTGAFNMAQAQLAHYQRTHIDMQFETRIFVCVGAQRLSSAVDRAAPARLNHSAPS